MQEQVQATRRAMLLGLASTLPMGWILQSTSAHAADVDEDFLWVSKVITGSEDISNDVAGRIEALLVDRVDGLTSRLDDLIAAMRATGQDDRTAMLTSLTDEQVVFALDIAKPWYLGYVGSPSSFTLEDDAAFATFLEAQSWEKIVDAVPRITYPGQGPGGGIRLRRAWTLRRCRTGS